MNGMPPFTQGGAALALGYPLLPFQGIIDPGPFLIIFFYLR